MADLKDFVGKRILVKKADSEDVFETEIAEVSPSGNYVRVGDENWVEAKEYEVVEELAPVDIGYREGSSPVATNIRAKPGEEKPTVETVPLQTEEKQAD